ncbi:hypothetical protein C8R45DRAFT_1135776 [Mycena sanguinolenta]|nr:hypothetical protein C8R45DRAFT_1135776 [Mycena sanguinolenta]
MKSSFNAVAFATSALLLALYASPSASAPAQSTTVTSPSPLTCGDPSDAVPLYITDSPGQTFYYTILNTDVDALIGPYGYSFLGIAARVFPTQELSTVPFFHVQNDQTVDNFYTTSATARDNALENGYVNSSTGIAAYIYTSEICGSVPFYELYSTAATEHFYTINETDYDAKLASGAWTDEGIAGYVLDFDSC